jgi:hypothetical protein
MSQAYLEIEQYAQALGDPMHRRRSHLTSPRAESVLGDGSDLVAECIARASQPTFGRAHFHVERNPTLCPRERKHHDEARGAPVEGIGRNDDRRADEVLLVAPCGAQIDRPDFAA